MIAEPPIHHETLAEIAAMHQRALFGNLPDKIRERVPHNALVRGWVQSFLEGYITRDQMMEGMACGLAMQNELMSQKIAAYMQRFGALRQEDRAA